MVLKDSFHGEHFLCAEALWVSARPFALVGLSVEALWSSHCTLNAKDGTRKGCGLWDPGTDVTSLLQVEKLRLRGPIPRLGPSPTL